MLPAEIRETVANAVRNWPRKLDANGLLRELDLLARRVAEQTKMYCQSSNCPYKQSEKKDD